MTISPRWWEPEPQDHEHDREERGRYFFDLDDLQSLAIGGGEFANFAELLCCAGRGRELAAHPLPQRNTPAPGQEILG